MRPNFVKLQLVDIGNLTIETRVLSLHSAEPLAGASPSNNTCSPEEQAALLALVPWVLSVYEVDEGLLVHVVPSAQQEAPSDLCASARSFMIQDCHLF